jgi:DNA polymerase-3 subunit delta
MKVSPRLVDGFLKDQSAEIAVTLIYGPDAGLVRERGQALGSAIVDDLQDPFRVVDLTEQDLKSDPARLMDEVCAISMGGGRRLIRIRNVGDSHTKIFAALLEGDLSDDSFVVAEAGELPARSSLRKLFESAKNAAAIACYSDDARAIENLVSRMLHSRGLTIEPDAQHDLVERTGSDRGVTRSEIEKLVQFMGPRAGKDAVTLADVRACLGDTAAESIDAIVEAAAGGQLDKLGRALARCADTGIAPTRVLRSVGNHFARLALVVSRIDRGEPPERAIAALRPPVHFSRRRAFEQQCRAWRPPLLAHASNLLIDAEAQCKSTGLPDQAICEHALTRIAAAAHRR